MSNGVDQDAGNCLVDDPLRYPTLAIVQYVTTPYINSDLTK